MSNKEEISRNLKSRGWNSPLKISYPEFKEDSDEFRDVRSPSPESDPNDEFRDVRSPTPERKISDIKKSSNILNFGNFGKEYRDARSLTPERNIKKSSNNLPILNEFKDEYIEDDFLDVRSPKTERIPSEEYKDNDFLDVTNTGRSEEYKDNDFLDVRSPEIQKKKQFKFLESSGSDIYTNTDESSYDSSIDEKIRRKMKLPDRQNALYEALTYLAKGDYKSFLRDDYIHRLFAPARALIESCGRGDKSNKTEKLWKLAWEGKLEVKKSVFSIPKSECISCAQDRDLNYVFYEETPLGLKKLGYMGPACYEIRFRTLIKLIKASKKAAELLSYKDYQPGSREFEQYIMNPILTAKDKVIQAPENMGKYRNPVRRI
jgi:hypothetical protein